MAEPHIEPLTLTQQAYEDLEERITTLVLKPGEVLSESRLSQTLGIGRTPVREALQRLAREGLVSIMPRRGILVSDFDVAAQLRMLEVRRVVEQLMARNAARRASAEQKASFAQIAVGMRDAASNNDDIGFMRLDRAFNALLAEACRNEFASATIELMGGLARRFWFMHHLHVGDDLQTIAARHIDVAEAIAASDTEKAEASTTALLDYIGEITRAAIEW
jgi:DNA-binding GntR family transcriptional regulator